VLPGMNDSKGFAAVIW